MDRGSCPWEGALPEGTPGFIPSNDYFLATPTLRTGGGWPGREDLGLEDPV